MHIKQMKKFLRNRPKPKQELAQIYLEHMKELPICIRTAFRTKSELIKDFEKFSKGWQEKHRLVILAE